MNHKTVRKSKLRAIALWAALSIPALAGPPLVCHRFDIGSAKSLPWGRDPAVWDQPLANYNVANLAGEALTLLSPDAPVIVHMETIRRAAIYAHRSPEAAKELIQKMGARAHDAAAQGKPDALALFDYGYLIEATKEVGRSYNAPAGGKEPNAAANLDGYPWVTRAIGASHDNPEMEFGAALIVMGRIDLKPHKEHAQAALAAGPADSLLARNLTAFFIGTRGDTINALLAKAATGNE